MVKPTKTEIYNDVFNLLNKLKERVVNDEKVSTAILPIDIMSQEPLVYVNKEIDFIYNYQHRFTKDDMSLIEEIVTSLGNLPGIKM